MLASLFKSQLAGLDDGLCNFDRTQSCRLDPEEHVATHSMTVRSISERKKERKKEMQGERNLTRNRFQSPHRRKSLRTRRVDSCGRLQAVGERRESRTQNPICAAGGHTRAACAGAAGELKPSQWALVVACTFSWHMILHQIQTNGMKTGATEVCLDKCEDTNGGPRNMFEGV